MALHFVALLFSICSLVLLLIANLGTTFTSTFLPEMYLVQVNEAVNGRYVRYGVYNSCLYYPDSKTAHSCTAKMPAYKFDANQFAELCGADSTNSSTASAYTDILNNANITTFQGIVLIMPAVILVFMAFCCTMLIRRLRETNVVPFVGAFTSLFGFFTGAAGLALTIATFWKGLEYLEKAIEGLSHQWGPSIYLVGIGSGCILVTLVCFIISLFTYNREDYKRDSFHLNDYDLNNTYRNSAAAYNSTTPIKQDDYEYTHAISSPTRQNYPSYHQQQYQQQQPYNSNYNQNYYG